MVDVYVASIKNSDGAIVYSTYHTVFSYRTINSVSVQTANSIATSLNNFENKGNTFFYDPPKSEYSNTPPRVCPYMYNVIFSDGEEKTYINSLSDAILAPANITSLEKSANGDSVYISWDAIANAHIYQIQIFKGETTQVDYYSSNTDSNNPRKTKLRSGIPINRITTYGSGIYTFELKSLLYENGDLNKFQAISTSTKDIAL